LNNVEAPKDDGQIGPGKKPFCQQGKYTIKKYYPQPLTPVPFKKNEVKSDR
jgi:hypothetical protein